MTIPYFFKPFSGVFRVSEETLEEAASGKYRFDPEKFTEVVQSCPGVDEKAKALVLRAVKEAAANEDGSIDVMKSGMVLGTLLRETNDDAGITAIAVWINNLDRLPMYKVE